MPGSVGEYGADVTDVWLVNETSLPTWVPPVVQLGAVVPGPQTKNLAVPLGLGLPSFGVNVTVSVTEPPGTLT